LRLGPSREGSTVSSELSRRHERQHAPARWQGSSCDRLCVEQRSTGSSLPRDCSGSVEPQPMADRQAQAARAERRRSGARSEAPVKQDPHAGSVARRSIEARQILARFSDASFPTYLFLYSLLYFGDVIYCKYPSSKYRREYRFPLCEACLYIVKKKTRAAFPLFTPSHRPKLDRARSPPRAVRRARAVCPCQRPLPPIDRLWADSCKRFSAYRWWPVAGTGLPDAAAHDSCDATDTPLCC
jgi:hypothetical protein